MPELVAFVGPAVVPLLVPGAELAVLGLAGVSCLAHRPGPMPWLEAVTAYRALLMLSVCACILAVDFQLWFPQALAKTSGHEAASYPAASLMDVGAASFAFSLGIVEASRSAPPALRRSLTRALMLVALGLARILLVKSTK